MMSQDESIFAKKKKKTCFLLLLFGFTKSKVYFIENNMDCEQFGVFMGISRIIFGGEAIIVF